MFKVSLDVKKSCWNKENTRQIRTIHDAYQELEPYILGTWYPKGDILKRAKITNHGLVVDTFKVNHIDETYFIPQNKCVWFKEPHVLIRIERVWLRVVCIDEKDADRQIIRRLERRLHNQKKEIREMQLSLESKNKELDALHYVWCNGGCEDGVHRWTENNLTEELLQIAERNVRRLRTWFMNHQYRNKPNVYQISIFQKIRNWFGR